MRPRDFRALWIVGALGACTVAAVPAGAQAPPAGAKGAAPPAASAAPAPAVKPEAKKPYNDALADFKKGEFEKAYKGFLEAWNRQGLPRIPRIVGNLGRAELKVKKYRDAAEHLAWYLKQAPSEQDRQEYGRLLDEAKTHVGTLRVEVVQAGAEVSVGGVSVGASPIEDEVYVEPGRLSVEAKLGELRARKVVDARAGGAETVKLELTPPVAPQPSQTQSSPPPPPPPPPPKPFPARTVFLASGAAIAAVGLGIGIGTGAVSLSKQSEQDRCLELELDKQESCWKQVDPERRSLAAASLAGSLVGGVAAAATITYYLVGKKADSQKTATTIRIAPMGAGLLVTGSW